MCSIAECVFVFFYYWCIQAHLCNSYTSKVRAKYNEINEISINIYVAELCSMRERVKMLSDTYTKPDINIMYPNGFSIIVKWDLLLIIGLMMCIHLTCWHMQHFHAISAQCMLHAQFVWMISNYPNYIWVMVIYYYAVL